MAAASSQGTLTPRASGSVISEEVSSQEQSLIGNSSGVDVGTSTMPQATADSTAQKSFYALGVFWAFYANGTGLMVGTSTDGINWNSSSTPLGNSLQKPFSGSANPGGVGDDFAAWFDGTYFQFVYTPFAYGDDVYYVRATPFANGSIVWGALQVACPGVSSECWYSAHICTDSSGRSWIMFCGIASNDTVDVTYSATSNGSWTTASGFPEVVGVGNSIAIVPLTDDELYAVWETAPWQIAPGAYHVEGALYDGFSFGSTEDIYDVALGNYPFAVATACGDTVVVALQSGDSSYDVVSMIRNYPTSRWSSPMLIQAGDGNRFYEWVTPELTVDPATRTLYCFWAGNPNMSYVYYSNCSLASGTWSAPTAWLYEPLLLSSGLRYMHWCVMSFSQVYGGYVGLEYTVGDASPWQVKFAYLSLGTHVKAVGGRVGITGYKLLFQETMGNFFGSQAMVTYSWSFSAQAWNGSQWFATGLDAGTSSCGSVLPALATVDLPIYVCLLDPSAVTWNEWLKIEFQFLWTYNGTSYSASYVAKLNVHPADMAGSSSVAFPYFGADGRVSTADLTLLARNWGTSVRWTGAFDPTDEMHLADAGMFGRVSIGDLTMLAVEEGSAWTNTPPPG